MKRYGLTLKVIAGAAVALALTFTARTQNRTNVIALNNRSFVATTGDDANTCTSAAYCRTFARALAMTNSGGEIVVVNSGGYGPFSITQPVVITAIGIDAAVTQTASGQDAITINTTGNVTITGLNLNGGGTGNDGVQVANVGILRLYSMQIQGFASYGIDFASGTALSMYDSKVSGNGYGLAFNGSKAYAHNTAFDNNSFDGVFVGGGYVVIADSSAENNTNHGISSVGGTVVLDNDKVGGNGWGLSPQLSGQMYFTHCAISGNTYAYLIVNGGTLAGSNPGTSLIAPGQLTSGAISTAINLQ